MDKKIHLQKVIDQHQLWLKDHSQGSRAYLADLDLSG